MKSTICTALILCAALALPVSARAGETRVYIGAEVAGGKHSDVFYRLTGGDARAPIFALRHDSGNISLALDHVPVDTVDLGNGRRLSIGYTQANAQIWNHAHRFAVAAGETMYFLQDSYTSSFGTQNFATRTAGTAFGVLAAMPAGRHTAVTVSLFSAPSMHERTAEWLSSGMHGLPEFTKASMTDAALGAENRFSSHAEMAYGLRYINYSGGNPSLSVGADPGRIRTAVLGGFVAFGFRMR